MFDYHVHPDYSTDAVGSLDEYCQRAIALGLEGICFTTHYDIHPKRQEKVRCRGKLISVDEDWLPLYLEDLEQIRSVYEGRLKVKFGLEVDYYSDLLEEELRKRLSKFRFDFLLGGIHCLDALAITNKNESQVYFANHTLEETAENYFQTMKKSIQSGLFDALAHLDIYRRYGTAFYGEKITGIHRLFSEDVLSLMADRNMCIEVNTGAVRHGLAEFYPSVEILKLARKKGVKYAAIGSDAHKVEQLGEHLKTAYQLTEELGFDLYRI